jgi:hypothetical protein
VQTVLTLTSFTVISSTDYNNKVTILREILTSTEKNNFLQSIIDDYSQYGKFSDASLHYLWTGLDSGLKIIQNFKSLSFNPKNNHISQNSMLSILNNAVKHMNLSTTATAPYVMSSCTLIIQTINEVFFNSDDQESILTTNKQLVYNLCVEAMEIAWSVVLSDDINSTVIQTFIMFAFDSSSLTIFESSVLQVFIYLFDLHFLAGIMFLLIYIFF